MGGCLPREVSVQGGVYLVRRGVCLGGGRGFLPRGCLSKGIYPLDTEADIPRGQNDRRL